MANRPVQTEDQSVGMDASTDVDALVADSTTTGDSALIEDTSASAPTPVEVKVVDAQGSDPLLTTDPKNSNADVTEIPYAQTLVETASLPLINLSTPTVDPSYENVVETVEGGSKVENSPQDFDRMNKVPTAFSSPPVVDAVSE